MKLFFYSFLVFFILNIQVGFSQNAPVSTIGEVVSNESTNTIPITATGFNNIGSCNIQILYDPAIATCTSVNLGPGMVGGIATNLTIPGVITIGWYTWPGITLPDNTVLFELNFSRVGYGLSEITWDVDYLDRQWSNGEFVQLMDTPVGSFYIDGSLLFLTENAPKTYAPDLIGIQGSTIQVPVTVVDFDNIGSINLFLDYDIGVLSYQSFTNDSGFPGLSVDGTLSGTIITTAIVNAGNSGFFLSDNDTLFTLVFSYLGGSSGLVWNNNGTSSQYTGYPDYNVLTDTPTEGFYFNGSVGETIELGITVYLEGPFNGTDMDTHLNGNPELVDGLPLSQPYNITPWNYNGTESVPSIPSPDVVDWIIVELRDAADVASATNATIIQQQAAFLLRDGSVVDLDAVSNIILSNSLTNQLFVVIRHRNHIDIISANSLTDAGGVYSYNFTLAIDKVYGGAVGYKDIASGVYGMAGGDGNADGDIGIPDLNGVWKPQSGTTGYLMGDYSLDNEVNNVDKNDVCLPNDGLESQVPE